MASSLDELEDMAEEYAKQKQTRAGRDSKNVQDRKKKDTNSEQHPNDIAIKIIDSIASPAFIFPIREETLESEGTVTYLYQNGAVYPKLYEFLGEILHTSIPIVINDVKFGPGEIIVKENTSKLKSRAAGEEDEGKKNGDRDEANLELLRAMKELQKLVHGRRTKLPS